MKEQKEQKAARESVIQCPMSSPCANLVEIYKDVGDWAQWGELGGGRWEQLDPNFEKQACVWF